MTPIDPPAGPRPARLDVVLVATLRPGILSLTLDSFGRRLLRGTPVRLIVNVDPIGEDGVTQQDVLALCREHFDDVVARTPSQPSFAAAVKWCWEQVESPVFFHLEDDWCLRREVPVAQVRAMFDADPALVGVRLNLSPNRRARSDGRYLVSGRVSLNPSFFRTAYIREQLPRFDLGADPEKQWLGHEATRGWPQPVFAYWGTARDPALVIDTGKRWRRSVGLTKGAGAGGLAWTQAARGGLTVAWTRFKYRAFLGWWRLRYARAGIDGDTAARPPREGSGPGPR